MGRRAREAESGTASLTEEWRHWLCLAAKHVDLFTLLIHPASFRHGIRAWFDAVLAWWKGLAKAETSYQLSLALRATWQWRFCGSCIAVFSAECNAPAQHNMGTVVLWCSE